MRFSVRWLDVCAGEEKRTLRKSALCTSSVTERRILRVACDGKAHSAATALRKSTVRERGSGEGMGGPPRTYGNCVAQAMAAPKHSAAMTQVMQMDLLPSPFTLPVTTAIRATSTEKLPTVVRLSVRTACRSTYAA